MASPSHHRNVTTSQQQKILLHPRDDDVICGRGPTKHPGNRMYHALVTASKKQYRELPLGHKKLLARSIVDALHPSRFLIKQETNVKVPIEELQQLPNQCNTVHDDHAKQNRDDASDNNDNKDKVVIHDICMSAMAISQSESFETYSSSTTSLTTTPTGSGRSTPQQEGVYYYYLVLDREAAIRKTSQALREKGGSSGNAAVHDGESGGVAGLNNEVAHGDHADDCALEILLNICDGHYDESDPSILRANKKPRRGYDAVATLGTLLQQEEKDRIVTFAPVPREVLERQVEMRFSHIQAMLNNARSSQLTQGNHDEWDGHLQ